MSDKSLETQLDQVKEDLNSPVPEPGETPKEEKKMATAKKKAPPKKVGKIEKTTKVTKTAKTNGAAESEGLVKLSALANEAGISAQRARQKLRGAELARDGRWAWPEGSKALKEARKALGLEG
jgi:hypothetical protein